MDWIEACVHEPFPDNMVQGGTDTDGSAIFVGRANHNGDLLPAKVIPQKKMAFVSHSMEEITVQHFEVLCGENFVWKHSCGGKVPADAVPVGNTVDGEILYVGRANHAGSLTIGKVHKSHNCLYIPYGGKEISIESYEVLCKNDDNIECF